MSPGSATIVHYNDVYNIEPRTQEPCGGAARFASAVASFSHLEPLVLFSGDVFSPSMLSSLTRGAQMVPVLNHVGTHCAVLGNHDFDFGLEVLSERVAECNFPWLMSNVIDKETGRPLGEGLTSHILTSKGHRIGIVGLVEREWLDTLATINPEELTFLDYVEVGNSLAEELRQQGCDCVIALTHMRMPNDIKLAENCTGIDLILGGHDHVYDIRQVNGIYIVKSGTDFRQLSKITLNFRPTGGVDVEVERVDVSSSAFQEDAQLKEELHQYSSMMEGKLEEVLGEFTVELDGRFEAVRTRETNLGNWVCDILLAATGADLAILNSGTLRSDRIHPPGPFTLGDLMSVIPNQDMVCVIEVTGNDIVEALENAVCMYPKLEGRFAQVGGVSFGFDPDAPSGKRVAQDLIRIGDEPLVRSQSYRLVTKTYLQTGCDGYTIFKKAKVLVSDEECPDLGLAIQNHFQAIKTRLGKTKRPSKHRQSLVMLSRRHSLVKMLDGEEADVTTTLRRGTSVDTGHPKLTRRASIDDLEQESCMLAPRIEGRIIHINPQRYKELLAEEERRKASVAVIEEVEEAESPTHGRC